MSDAERKSFHLLDEYAGQVRDGNLQQALRSQRQQAQDQLENLDRCITAIGAARWDLECLPIDAMHAQLQAFAGEQPSPAVMEMKVLGTALDIAYFEIASYKSLVDKAILMGQTQCAQILRASLVMNEEVAGRLQRIGHEVNQRVLATA
jgi:ferritin-like metal-binding protein YciE